MNERPSLEDILRRLANSRRLTQVLLVRSEDGRFQASMRQGQSAAYRIMIRADPVDALAEAMGPYYGQTWDDHLGPAKSAQQEVLDDLI